MTEKKLDDLEILAQQASTLEAEQPTSGEPAPPPAPPVQTNAQLLAGTFQLAREAFCIIGEVRSPRAVLDDGTLQQLGDAWGAVADKRGWDLSKLMGDYGPEVAAVMLTITVGTKLAKVVQAELQAINASKITSRPDGETGDAG